ncbi:hypothetical protein ES332_A11G231500v1 [Gossypium tomentosum]|uniref:Uncharacterized protein n=1 Tax=Gossypium tomentosum TaxID=34277 RepID=A0A5D2NDL6_GOSTO|nr:hypothetical protein ES332_A11G231500v1 [Gossypium tomentosum]
MGRHLIPDEKEKYASASSISFAKRRNESNITAHATPS